MIAGLYLRVERQLRVLVVRSRPKNYRMCQKLHRDTRVTELHRTP